MKILVTPPVTERQKKILTDAAKDAEFIFCQKQDVTETILRDVDIILGNLQSASQLAWTKKLKWIQLNNAGTEGYCEPGILPGNAVLCNATGAYGLAISEHMIGCLFELRKKLQHYYKNQLEHNWKSEGFVDVIQGSTVLVIGLGDIGGAFAGKMKALGCKTIGIRRRNLTQKPDCVDRLCGMQQLDELLPEADVVALNLPGNAATRHVLNRERIAAMKKTAVVINVGRGSAIDTHALCDALYEGRLAGAALDVTDPEPLPPEHPLWDAPGALITPHISGGYSLPETLEQIVGLFAENLLRYEKGQPLRNQIDLQTGYVKG